jgi:hypothetical protein
MNGIDACEKAFQRLREGKPIVSAHVGIEKGKITAGIVSVEAGFDRGYLKKSRIKHLALLAQIESFRKSDPPSSGSLPMKYRRAKAKIGFLEDEIKCCKSTMHKVLSQNLLLVETVRRLEAFLKGS